MDGLRRLSRQFSAALELADDLRASDETLSPEVVGTISPSSERTRWTRWRVTRAAAAIALIAAALTASPARAWLAQRWQELKSMVVGAPVEQPEIAPTAVQPGEPRSVITFTPAGPQFRLWVAHTQPGGTLYLTVDATASASAGIVGGDGSEEIVVLSDGFQIRNAATSTASYQLRLPNHLETIEVRIGDNPALTLDLTTLLGPFRREIDLSASDSAGR